MMRLDEGRIPKGGGVKIRCPRCKEIDYVEDPSLSKSRGQAPAAAGKIDIRTSKDRELSRRSAPAKGNAREESEPSIPDDAFHGFRFPAERETNSSSARTMRPWVRILIWGIVSLAVVAFFALLVNVVLSGPAGNNPLFDGKPSGKIDRQTPPN
jgi:hypothetical protein